MNKVPLLKMEKQKFVTFEKEPKKTDTNYFLTFYENGCNHS